MEYQNDKKLKELLSYSYTEMPFEDFEDELMNKISEEQSRNSIISKDLKRSWIFYICGIISGVLVLLIPLSDGNVQSGFFEQSIIQPFVIVGICVIILLFTEKLIKVTVKHTR